MVGADDRALAKETTHRFVCYSSDIPHAVRYLIGMLMLSAMTCPLRAEIYECRDRTSSLCYTDVKPEAKDCQRMVVLLSETMPSSQRQATFDRHETRTTTRRMTDAAWLATAYDHAEPSARLQSLEDWARGRRESLDAVSYALVDPDESIRTRAQALWEETLTRR